MFIELTKTWQGKQPGERIDVMSRRRREKAIRAGSVSDGFASRKPGKG